MTKQEFIDYCGEKVSDIRKELLVEDPEYEFYSDFFRDYSIKSVKTIVKIPIPELLIAWLNAVLPDKTFDEVSADVYSFASVFERFGFQDIAILQTALDVLYNSDDKNFDKLKNAFADTNRRRGYNFIFSNGEDELMQSVLKKLFDINNPVTADITKLLTYYEQYPQIMDHILVYIEASKEVADLYVKVQQMTRDATKGLSGANDKKNNKVVSMFMKDAVNHKKFIDDLVPVEAYYTGLSNNVRTSKRRLGKAEKAYLEFIKKFPKIFGEGEIRDYQSMIKDIPDEDVRLEFLKLVYEHNMEIYEKTMLTYNELAKNSSISFLTLLQGNNISKDEIRLSSVMKNDYDDVVKMLKVLKNMFDDKKLIIKGLETSTLIDILYLKELIDKGVLTKDSIANNISIFSSESSIRRVLNENIESVNEYGLNPSIFCLNPELLLKSEKLDYNLIVLEKYDLVKYLKGQNDYSFLDKEGLMTKIDKFLELGYEKYIKEDITLLNEDNIDRIYVLKSIGVMPETKEELLSYLRSEKFLVADDKLNEYIHNVVSYVKEDFALDIDSIINDYDSTNRTININGVVLSKNRIRRNKVLGSFQSIITDSILSKDEVDILKAELKKKELIKNS